MLWQRNGSWYFFDFRIDDFSKDTPTPWQGAPAAAGLII